MKEPGGVRRLCAAANLWRRHRLSMFSAFSARVNRHHRRIPYGPFVTPTGLVSAETSLPRTSWRPGRVYFLTLLEPLAGTTGLWPLPPGRPASANVGLPGAG